MRPLKEIRQIFDERAGFLRTKDLYAERIFYDDIQRLISEEHIEKIRYGYYQWVNPDNLSDTIIIKRLFPDGILCMDTALFFYGYSDRSSQSWHIAVSKDSGKSRFKLDYPFVKPYFVKHELLDMGLAEGVIDGNQMRIYNKERTICDCLRYEKKMDKEIFNNAIQHYIHDSSKKIPVLMNYAQKLRITNKVKNVIGVWL